jgi:hypothetical protein
LITLKALTYRPPRHRRRGDHLVTGKLAAGVTGLPLLLATGRDVHAALPHEFGFHREAEDWRLWLRRAVAGDPAQVQIMYGSPASEAR